MRYFHIGAWCARFILLLSLAACGGGGGDGGSTAAGGGSGTGSTGGTTGPGGGSATVTSLMPAAPAAGATLYADAALLRPIRDGAVWSYRGTSKASSVATPRDYTTTTTQTATGTAAAAEATSNGGNTGPDDQPVAVVNGIVGGPLTVDFTGKAPAETFQFIELQSPVRQCEQYNMLERRYTDTAIDADRDGLPDTLDVAIYARVVGNETVSLNNLPALTALRVDSVLRTRVIASSTGQPSPVVEATVQTWYAPGIGIVRQKSSAPTAGGADTETTDEQLLSWDGGSAGFGAMAARVAVVPQDSAVLPGQQLGEARSIQGAVAFDDHALLFIPSFAAFGQILAVRMDLRGKVTSVRSLPPSLTSGNLSVLRRGDGAALVRLDIENQTRLVITNTDADGRLLGTVDGVAIELAGSRLSASVGRTVLAADGATLWVGWSRGYYDFTAGRTGGETVLRAFGFDGVPQGPELVVDSGSGGLVAISAAGGQALLTWTLLSGGYDVMFSTATLAPASLRSSVLAAGLLSSNSFVTPLRLDVGGVLLWPAVLGSGANQAWAAGVRLDANWTPLRSATDLSAELVPGVPTFDGTLPKPQAVGSRVVVTGARTGLLTPSDLATQRLCTVSWIDSAPTTALASQPVNSVAMAWNAPTSQLAFTDRVLVFGTEPDRTTNLATTVVRLNGGTLR